MRLASIKRLFSIFLFFSWKNVTSIDFPKCGDLHLMNPTNSDSMW